MTPRRVRDTLRGTLKIAPAPVDPARAPSTPEVSKFSDLRESLRAPYLADPRPWLVGFSGGKDSTMVASLIFEAVASIPAEQRTKPISVLCTDTRASNGSCSAVKPAR